jgi:hypothetical protein
MLLKLYVVSNDGWCVNKSFPTEILYSFLVSRSDLHVRCILVSKMFTAVTVQVTQNCLKSEMGYKK